MTTKFQTRLASTLLAAASLAFSTGAHASELLLEYKFTEGSGVTVADTGPRKLNLTVGSDFSWGVPGSGVGGGTALGRTGDRDIVLENKTAADAGLDYLRSYTISGWFELDFQDRTTGTIIELETTEGNSFTLQLASKPAADGREGLDYSLVCTFGAGGRQYSNWSDQIVSIGEWRFFAVTIDATRPEHQVAFYTGSATEPVSSLGFFREPAQGRDVRIGKVSSIRLGNAADRRSPVPTGTWLDDIRFHGSANDGTGALSAGEVDIVRLQATR